MNYISTAEKTFSSICFLAVGRETLDRSTSSTVRSNRFVLVGPEGVSGVNELMTQLRFLDTAGVRHRISMKLALVYFTFQEVFIDHSITTVGRIGPSRKRAGKCREYKSHSTSLRKKIRNGTITRRSWWHFEEASLGLEQTARRKCPTMTIDQHRLAGSKRKPEPHLSSSPEIIIQPHPDLFVFAVVQLATLP